MNRRAFPCFLIAAFLFLTGATSTDGSAADYRMVPDLLYRDGAAAESDEYIRERCRLDLYHPVDSPGFATLVWFHGGGLRGGGKSVPEALREQGIAVVAANYRLHPRVSAPVYIQDAAAAVAWTFREIEKYGGDRSKIFVSGHSAGGYLTSMLGLDKGYLAEFGIDADEIAGLIPFSGHTITHFTVRQERGIPEHQALVDDLAPLYHVRAEAPPVILITGDRNLELLGRYEENLYFWRMLRVAGHLRNWIYELQGYNHGGMAQPAFPILLKHLREIGEIK